MPEPTVGVIGATGAVGRTMLEQLLANGFTRLTAFASRRSAGQQLTIADRQLTVQEFSPEACAKIDYLLVSAGGDFARAHLKHLATTSVCIDNSSAFRMADDVPLVVPEVNCSILDVSKPIIANPNCSTIQLVVPLFYLAKEFVLKRVTVATYQSVSGAGQRGIEELTTGKQQTFAQPIANNILPAIDRFDETGHCFEEIKMVQETRKILDLPQLPVQATTVRVPVVYGHSEAVTIDLGCSVSKDQVIDCLKGQLGLQVVDCQDHATLPTPLTVAGSDDIYVTRIRLPHGEQRSSIVQLFIIADNLRKGAATNAVQILCYLVKGDW